MASILVLNAGSSSLKFAVYGADGHAPDAEGQVDRIGGAEPATLWLRDSAGNKIDVPPPGNLDGHAAALKAALAALENALPDLSIDAVGHRIVHGGPDFGAPIILDDDVLNRLSEFNPLAPLHQPHGLAGVRAARAAFPEATQVGCFDTAFHRHKPKVNDLFALPKEWYDKGVRRYGFHGLSYDYISGEMARRHPAMRRIIVAHLGNGASACAIRDGKCVASTMGFSALDGLAMGTRSGQIDPGVLLYFLQHEGMSADQISDLLYKRSGLLGLSGLSNDMRRLEQSDDPAAAQAIDYFVARLRGEIARLAATMSGADALVFTAGIGENSPMIRDRACAGMDFIGIALDPAANEAGAEKISAPGSKVAVFVLPTHEDQVILKAARALT